MTLVRRTICLALLVALGGIAAGAASATTADEGTLSVKRGDGEFTISHAGSCGRPAAERHPHRRDPCLQELR